VRLQLLQGRGGAALPFRRRQLVPPDLAGGKILSPAADHFHQRFIGKGDLSGEVEQCDADHAAVAEAPKSLIARPLLLMRRRQLLPERLHLGLQLPQTRRHSVLVFAPFPWLHPSEPPVRDLLLSLVPLR
jgi:hypothetical protein